MRQANVFWSDGALRRAWPCGICYSKGCLPDCVRGVSQEHPRKHRCSATVFLGTPLPQQQLNRESQVYGVQKSLSLALSLPTVQFARTTDNWHPCATMQGSLAGHITHHGAPELGAGPQLSGAGECEACIVGAPQSPAQPHEFWQVPAPPMPSSLS